MRTPVGDVNSQLHDSGKIGPLHYTVASRGQGLAVRFEPDEVVASGDWLGIANVCAVFIREQLGLDDEATPVYGKTNGNAPHFFVFPIGNSEKLPALTHVIEHLKSSVDASVLSGVEVYERLENHKRNSAKPPLTPDPTRLSSEEDTIRQEVIPIDNTFDCKIDLWHGHIRVALEKNNKWLGAVPKEIASVFMKRAHRVFGMIQSEIEQNVESIEIYTSQEESDLRITQGHLGLSMTLSPRNPGEENAELLYRMIIATVATVRPAAFIGLKDLHQQIGCVPIRK